MGATLSLARTPPSPKKMPSWGAQGMRGLSWVLQPGCPRSGCAATVLASSLPPLASSLPPAALLMGEAKSCPPPPPPNLAGAWLLWETRGFPLVMG